MDNQTIPQKLSILFWDVDPSKLDIHEYSTFIIERILNMGNEDDLRWAWQTYSEEEILQVVQTSRKLSKKSARCWQNYFNLREDQMRCFSKYSTSLDKIF